MIKGLGKTIVKTAVIIIVTILLVTGVSYALAHILGMADYSLTFILFGFLLSGILAILWVVGIIKLPHSKNLLEFLLRDIEISATTRVYAPRNNEWQRQRSLGVRFNQNDDFSQGMLQDRKGDDTEEISILFVSADPTDASRLRLGEEFREIHEKLKLAQLRDRFKLELPQMSVRPADVSQALLDIQPQIVHFSGHGTSTGALCFESQTGQIQLVQPDALAALFEQFAKQVSCVLLNACYSEIQAKAIAEHIEYVIGMNKAIGDKAAIAFAIGFYQALGAGRTFEDAYKLGCVQIRLQDIPEHLVVSLNDLD